MNQPPIIDTSPRPYRRRPSRTVGWVPTLLAFTLGSVATVAAAIYMVKHTPPWARALTSVVIQSTGTPSPVPSEPLKFHVMVGDSSTPITLTTQEPAPAIVKDAKTPPPPDTPKPAPPIGEYQKPILFRGVAVVVEEAAVTHRGVDTIYREYDYSWRDRTGSIGGLIVTLTVASPSPKTKPTVPNWTASLTDDLGNTYASKGVAYNKAIDGDTYQPGESLYPGKLMTQILVFEEPLPAAKSLNLTLNDGGESLTIRLPVPPSPSTAPAAPRVRIPELRDSALFRGVKVTAVRTNNSGYTLRNTREPDKSKPYDGKVEGRSIVLKVEAYSGYMIDAKAPAWTAKLLDDNGHAYNRLPLGPDEAPSGDTYAPGEIIHPKKPMTQILLFEKTLPDTGSLTLTLEDGGESLTIRLPVVTGDADGKQR